MSTGGILADSDDDEVDALMAEPPPPPPPAPVAKDTTPPKKIKKRKKEEPAIVKSTLATPITNKGRRNFYDDALLARSSEPMTCYDRLARYVQECVPEYKESQVMNVSNLVFACMITDTDKYTTLETLRDFIKETSKTKVRNFLSSRVFNHPREPSDADLWFTNKSYEALQAFVDTMDTCRAR
tara:strand:+ start:183 stop:731 length:549 start_codon:yes stop_codon:yes gene_type:complete